MSRREGSRDRRAEAVLAGVGAFADLGLTSAAVRRAAAEVGVSSAYLFRLFGSQRDFFLACLDRIEDAMLAAVSAPAPGGDPEEALSRSFREFVADGSVTGLWLQACAVARNDEEVARRCRRLMARGLRAVAAARGTEPGLLADVLARGALVMTLQALSVDLAVDLGAGVAALLAEPE